MKIWSCLYKLNIYLCCVFLSLALCCGCSKHQHFIEEDPILPTGVAGASEQMILFLQNKMSKEGIRVITMGQNYLISIPSSLLFHNQSPALTWKSYELLNDIACYLRQFRKISVHINSFGSCYISRHRAMALTLNRSRVIGDYLSSQGIDSRFIFTRGLGNDAPIVEYAKKTDTSPNSRIEITFRSAV